MPDKHKDNQNIEDEQSKLSLTDESVSYSEEQKEGVKFLRKKFADLHTSPESLSATRRMEARDGEKVSQKPEARISNYNHRFQEILNRKDEGKRQRGIEALKKIMHRQHVIKPEDIPQSYWNKQAEIIISQGRKAELREGGVREERFIDKQGNEKTNYIFPDEMRRQNTEVIIADQTSTMDNWLNYLTSHDAEAYPDWSKYWSFRSMLGLSTYDKEKKRFGKRSKDTVAPFPDLNREALAFVVDIITKKVKGQHIEASEDNPELEKLIKSENFAKFYAYAIEKVTPAEAAELEKAAGEWVIYKQGSDHMPLVNSLQGHGTGWCTAGESTSEAQLRTGGFHVYYSYDKAEKPTVPRIAIRMEGDSIAEVRGVAAEQNLDAYVADIAKKKLAEFPDGPAYQKKADDMKQLTIVENKQKKGAELSESDIRFLYELDGKIEGFGYDDDPRIREVKTERDIKEDASIINIITALEERFQNSPAHYKRPEGIDITQVKSALEANPEAVAMLAVMEITGGAPDIIEETDDAFIFADCSAESPNRRNLTYDQATEMAKKHGIALMDEETYRKMQETGKFDLNSGSWLKTTDDIRESGFALGGDRRGAGVYVRRYYAAYHDSGNGWRGLLRVQKA